MRTLLCVALLLTVAGCGGQGEGGAAPSSLPSVTRSVTRTPVQPDETRSADGPTASPPTRSGRPQRTSQAPKPSGVEPTRTRSAGAAPAEPSPTSATVTTTIKIPSPTPSATQPDAVATSDDEADVAPWIWWAVGLLAVTAVFTGAVLFRRRRARVEWATGLDETLAEVTWLSTDLIPTLLGQSVSGRVGVWAIGRPRVLRLEQTLEGLVGHAPDDLTARDCTALSSTIQALRRVLDQPEAADDVGGEASTTALRQVQRQLDGAVVALQGRSGAGCSR